MTKKVTRQDTLTSQEELDETGVDLRQYRTVLEMYANQVAGTEQVLFTETDVPAGKHPETYYISEKDWEKMGEPTVITITVEPGDKLHVEYSGEEILHRDAGTGQFVTEEYAEAHPETTVTES